MCRMRHPHLVSFLGLCTLPPCILTGVGGLVWEVTWSPTRSPPLLQQQQASGLGTRNPWPIDFTHTRLQNAAEYCSRGSLYDVLKQGTRLPAAAAELTWRRRVDIALGAARGLLYLHLSSPAILHCDVRWASPALGLAGWVHLQLWGLQQRPAWHSG